MIETYCPLLKSHLADPICIVSHGEYFLNSNKIILGRALC